MKVYNVHRAPRRSSAIQKKYYKTVDRIKPNAAEEQYSAGMYQLSIANRKNAKRAYNYFLKADKFIPGYKDVEQMIDEAYHRSILHVVANLKPVQSRTYELSADIFLPTS